MSTARLLIGDVFERLAEIPDGSVDLVLTSPPFLALRSYLPADHPDKGKEIGIEPTPADFVDTLLELSSELGRVLAPHGTLAVELGDTFAGSGGAGGDYYNAEGWRAGQPKPPGAKRLAASTSTPRSNRRRYRNPDMDGGPMRDRDLDEHLGVIPPRSHTRRQIPGWPLNKSLSMVPELYRVALAYGIHPLTGEPSPAGLWRVRNVVRWVRTNPSIGREGDKFRRATTDIVVACTSDARWFDEEAARVPGVEAGETAPMLDWWLVSTEVYTGAHYATWPRRLCVPAIEAMCPRQVCTTCGEPRRRLVDAEPSPFTGQPGVAERRGGLRNGPGATGKGHRSASRRATTTGWSDCGHDTWRRGMVLDPFAGSGTTLAVATGHGRDAIGIDLDARNADLALQRVGPLYLEVDYGPSGEHSVTDGSALGLVDHDDPADGARRDDDGLSGLGSHELDGLPGLRARDHTDDGDGILVDLGVEVAGPDGGGHGRAAYDHVAGAGT